MVSADGVNSGWSAALAALPWTPAVPRSSRVPSIAQFLPDRLVSALALIDTPVIAVVWAREDDPAALLGRLLAKTGWDGVLTRTDLGAPESPWLKARRLSVSLTHTDGLVACAVARGGVVGVDAEAVDPAVDTDAVAALHFGADAATGETDEEKRDRFFRLWALQEAALKALGVGFATPVDLTLTLDPTTIKGGEPAGLVWKAFEIDCGPAHRLAAAMAVSPDLQPLLIAGELI